MEPSLFLVSFVLTLLSLGTMIFFLKKIGSDLNKGDSPDVNDVLNARNYLLSSLFWILMILISIFI